MTPAQINRLSKRFPRRWDRHYVASKLRMDPLYEAVHAELEGSGLPLLDLGCGLGLLAFYLRERGHRFPIHGLDYDHRKIRSAREITGRADAGLRFDEHDARQGLPDHTGNVTILDILQFFSAGQIGSLLRLAAERVAPGGKLVVRSCLRDDSWRFRTTIAGDLFARGTLWMKDAPTHYPSAAEFEQVLTPYGEVKVSPLWGRTPFNNHLIVLRREPLESR